MEMGHVRPLQPSTLMKCTKDEQLSEWGLMMRGTIPTVREGLNSGQPFQDLDISFRFFIVPRKMYSISCLLSVAAPLFVTLCLIAATAYPAYSAGVVHTVKQDGTGNFTTIQSAVNACQAGDTIMVYEGLFPERVKWPSGKNGTSTSRITVAAQVPRQTTCYGFTLDSGGDFVTLDGFVITTNTDHGIEQSGVWTDRDAVTVEGCYFFECKGAAVDVTGFPPDYAPDHVIIKNNDAFKCSAGYWLGATSSLIEGNTSERLIAWRNNGYPNAKGDCDHIRVEGDNNVIRGNRLFGSIQAEIGTSHLDCLQSFADYGNHARNLIFEGNYCASVHEGMMLEAAGDSHDGMIIRNNIFNDIWSMAIDVNGPRGVLIYNNTFANCVIHAVGVSDNNVVDFGSADVRNNIFYNIYNPSGYWAETGCSVTGGNNLAYKTGVTLKSSLYSSTDIINVDPLFVDAPNLDFRLMPGSPAIDAGATLNIAVDKLGVARPQGAGFDIGCYEGVPAHVGTNPCALFSLSPCNGFEPLNVEFNGTFSIPNSAPIQSYAWNFGDGCQGNGATVSHTFARGIHEVRLTVTDSLGYSNTTCKNITVQAADTPNLNLCLDLNDNLLDTSGKQNHGSWKGTESYTTCKDGNGISLDGTTTGSYVSVPHSSTLDGMDRLTVCLWARKSVANTGGILVLKHIVYNLNLSSDRFQVYLMDDISHRFDLATPANSVIDTNWHHYALTHDGTALRLYIDGVQRAISQPASIGGVVTNSEKDVFIGKDPWGSTFKGSIDEVRVYDRALNSTEIMALVTGASQPTPTGTPATSTPTATHTNTVLAVSTPTPSRTATPNSTTTFTRTQTAPNASSPTPSRTVTSTTVSTTPTATPSRSATSINAPSPTPTRTLAEGATPNLNLHLTLDNSVADSSGLNNNAQWTGAASYTPGRSGQAIQLDGTSTGGYPFIRHSSTLDGMSQLTICLWARKNTVDAGGILLLKHITYNLNISNNRLQAYLMDDLPTRYDLYTPTGSMADTNWHHLALTHDGTMLRLYIDGVQRASLQPASLLKVETNPDREVFVGKDPWGNTFNGVIDDVRLYDRALSSSELLALASVPADPTPSQTPIPNTATPTRTATRTFSPLPSATKTNSPIPSPTMTRTSTPVPTQSQTPTRSNTLTAVPTQSPTRTASSSPSATPTGTSTVTQSPLPSPTRSSTRSSSPTSSPTSTFTAPPTATMTASRTTTSTISPTPTNTPTVSATASPTVTRTFTIAPTSTPSPTATSTPVWSWAYKLRIACMGETGLGVEPFLVRFFNGTYSTGCQGITLVDSPIAEVLVDWQTVVGGTKSAQLSCDLLTRSIVSEFTNAIHDQAAGLICATTEGMLPGEIYLRSIDPLFPVLMSEEIGLPCSESTGWPLKICQISNLWDGICGNEDSTNQQSSGLSLALIESDLPGTTRTPTHTHTLTKVPTRTYTKQPSATPTRTASHTLTLTPISTPTNTRTNSPTPIPTGTTVFTPSRTASPQMTATRSLTFTITPSNTWTPKPTSSPSFSPTRTRTKTPSSTSSPKVTTTPTISSSSKPTATPTRKFTYGRGGLYDYDNNGVIDIRDLIAIWNAGLLQSFVYPNVKADDVIPDLPERRVLLFELSLNWGKDTLE